MVVLLDLMRARRGLLFQFHPWPIRRVVLARGSRRADRIAGEFYEWKFRQVAAVPKAIDRDNRSHSGARAAIAACEPGISQLSALG
jgi:hypothetical protein